jgi:hypothetical protein
MGPAQISCRTSSECTGYAEYSLGITCLVYGLNISLLYGASTFLPGISFMGFLGGGFELSL